MDLKVWLDQGALVGTLTYRPNDNEFFFAYDLTWVAQGRFAISPHIATQGEHAPGAVARFLENLLPEGGALRDLAQILKVRSNNIYGLISALGAETTGALQFRQHSAPEVPTDFRPIPREELIQRIQQRARQPIITWDGKPRLSVAGVQEKLPITERDGVFGLGEGALASTHILKFANEKAPHLVINEFFCMHLARMAGLKVADCEILNLGERVLKVKRFDRHWQGADRVARTHMIDGCQALDLAPNMKYERFLGDEKHVADITGPANLKNIFDFSAKTKVPARTQIDLLHWVAFNLLIGNYDNHAKNISYFVSDEGISIAPFYDLVSVAMYPQFGHSLAFEIGATFDADAIDGYQLAEMASDLGLKKKFVAAQLRKVIQSSMKSVDVPVLTDASQDEASFLSDLKERVAGRGKKLLAAVEAMPKFHSV